MPLRPRPPRPGRFLTHRSPARDVGRAACLHMMLYVALGALLVAATFPLTHTGAAHARRTALAALDAGENPARGVPATDVMVVYGWMCSAWDEYALGRLMFAVSGAAFVASPLLWLLLVMARTTGVREMVSRLDLGEVFTFAAATVGGVGLPIFVGATGCSAGSLPLTPTVLACLVPLLGASRVAALVGQHCGVPRLGVSFFVCQLTFVLMAAAMLAGAAYPMASERAAVLARVVVYPLGAELITMPAWVVCGSLPGSSELGVARASLWFTTRLIVSSAGRVVALLLHSPAARVTCFLGMLITDVAMRHSRRARALWGHRVAVFLRRSSAVGPAGSGSGAGVGAAAAITPAPRWWAEGVLSLDLADVAALLLATSVVVCLRVSGMGAGPTDADGVADTVLWAAAQLVGLLLAQNGMLALAVLRGTDEQTPAAGSRAGTPLAVGGVTTVLVAASPRAPPGRLSDADLAGHESASNSALSSGQSSRSGSTGGFAVVSGFDSPLPLRSPMSSSARAPESPRTGPPPPRHGHGRSRGRHSHSHSDGDRDRRNHSHSHSHSHRDAGVAPLQLREELEAVNQALRRKRLKDAIQQSRALHTSLSARLAVILVQARRAHIIRHNWLVSQWRALLAALVVAAVMTTGVLMLTLFLPMVNICVPAVGDVEVGEAWVWCAA